MPRTATRSKLVRSATQTCLVVAYHFPPLHAAGTQRTRALVRHLPSFGWNPVVVTARPSPQEQVDPSLLAGLPSNLTCYRTGWVHLQEAVARTRSVWRSLQRSGPTEIPAAEREQRSVRGAGKGWMDWLSWWLQVPDSRIGWLPEGVWTGLRAIARHRCRVLYTTAPYWSAHLIGWLLHRATGLPWVADFRDPWRANTSRVIPHRAPDRLDGWLEEQVVSHAARIICNTTTVRNDFLQRFPEAPDRFLTVANGYEPEEFVGLTPRRLVGPETFVVMHAGDFYGSRRPEPLFAALHVFRERHPDLASRFRVLLLGRTDCDGVPLSSLAERAGVGALVQAHAPVPRRQALEIMLGSDALLVMSYQGDGAYLQVPCKLYEYLGVGRPILALTPSGSALEDMVRFAGGPTEVCDPDDHRAIAAALARLHDEPLAGGETLIRTELTRAYQARKIAELFGELAKAGS